ncbi:MAG TPA: hypothetical protein VGD21_08310 [Lysobacter sp.]
MDTEWNNDAARELVSIALVSEDGTKEFYAERDPLPGAPSRFVLEQVYRRLDGGLAALPDTSLGLALAEFMAQQGHCEVLADAPIDFTMLTRALSFSPSTHSSSYARHLIRDDATVMAQLEAYFAARPAEAARRHHALIDARALRTAWLAVHRAADHKPSK